MRTFVLFLAGSLTMFMAGCQSKLSEDEIIRKMTTERANGTISSTISRVIEIGIANIFMMNKIRGTSVMK